MLFNGLLDDETMVDLSRTVFVRSNNEAFKWANILADIHTDTEECNRQRFEFRLKLDHPLTLCWKVVYLHSWHPRKSWRLVSSIRSVSAASVAGCNKSVTQRGVWLGKWEKHWWKDHKWFFFGVFLRNFVFSFTKYTIQCAAISPKARLSSETIASCTFTLKLGNELSNFA